jgi:DNA-binding NarL/FixJ family response regulator
MDEGGSLTDHHSQTATGQPRGGLRVLVVDDHEGFRATACDILIAAGFDVVGQASDGFDALVQVGPTRADVVLLDIGLPDMDGFEVCNRLAMLEVPPAVIFVSSRDASEYRDRLAGSASRGFISKAALSGDAVAALVG